jgi:hypothetical protein
LVRWLSRGISSLALSGWLLLPHPQFAMATEDWLPITSEELKLISEPKAPGAPAIYLYRQFDRDDPDSKEYFYFRIKVLTEEGRKYGSVEIPFVKGVGNVKKIEARTVHLDGSIINFNGTVYEKTIVKAKGVKVLAKTLTLPDIQVGSIIEYRYTRTLDWGYGLRWLLSEQLFTKRAKFSYHYYTGRFALEWLWPLGLPEGTAPPKEENHTISLETQNVPAFQAEDFMPPQDEMKYRIEFIYVYNGMTDPEQFWQNETRLQYRGVEEFIDKHKPMEEAVANIVSQSDTPEVKLHKIYARTLQVHNSSFERERTEKEIHREKPPEIRTVEDVWKHNYGNRWAINWLFLALARAAGFDATPVLIATRNERFFDRRIMNSRLLNASVVVVKLNNQDRYFDPGTALAPYGMLPWYETDVPGLRLDREGGSWVQTPQMTATESRIERRAALQINEDGSLQGKVSITFVGLEALWRRLYEYNEGETERKKFLEDELKSSVPSGSELELSNHPEWDGVSPTLVAEFTVKIPNWVSSAGRRTLLPVGIFGGTEKHVFDTGNRVSPIYFTFPYQNLDDITVQLPAGMQVGSVPDLRNRDVKACVYSSTAKAEKDSIHISRQLTINLGLAAAKYYPALRNFYQHVRTDDEEPIVLTMATASTQN